MAELRLGEGAPVLLDDEDLSKVRGHTWFPLTFHGTTYAVANIRGADGTRRQQRMHQLLLGAGPADIVDHRNRNGLDNRRHNLRLVSSVTSNRNRRGCTHASPEFKGVSWCAQTERWKATIRCTAGGSVRTVTIGRFVEETKAASAYDLFAIRYWGEDALVLNFPERREEYKRLTTNNPALNEMRKLAKEVG